MMEMKRRNAILAAVIGVVIIAAAAGGIVLMNPGSNTATSNDGSSNGQSNGPGDVVATEISTAAINASIASPFAELAAEFNVTPNVSGAPDFVMKVAVSNNMGSNLTLNSSGFVATLSNGSSSRAIGNMSMTVEPNATAFPIIAFVTNGTNVRSVNYSSGSISFSVNGTFQVTDREVPGMVLSKGPQGNTTEVKNLTFRNLATWTISMGGFAPMTLKFNESANSSVVLALMTVKNTNTTNFSMSPSQFWLDVGNDTWVQGDMLANNMPRVVENNTTVPFLIGFRIADNMTVNGSMFFWPNQSQYLAQIPLNMNDGIKAIPTLALESIRQIANVTDGNATKGMGNNTGNATSNASTTQLMIELKAIGDNATASNVTDMMVWTLRNGSMSVSPQVSGDNRSLNVTVDLMKGDEVTMLSFNIGGETKYVWLRPLAPQT